MYKLQEENMWWPAIRYPSHQVAQEFMTQENYKSDFHFEILSQYLLECDPTYPGKPVVCVLAHPNKPPGKSWWLPVENTESTKPLTMLSVGELLKSTPAEFQNALQQTLKGVVLQKLASKEFRIDDSPTAARGAPHVSPETIQKSSGAVPTCPKRPEVSYSAIASQQPPSDSSEPTKNYPDTPFAAFPNNQEPVNTSAKKTAPEAHSETPISSEPEEKADPVNTSAEESTPEDEPMPMEIGYETAPFDLNASFEVAWDKLEDEGWYEHRSSVDWNMYYSQPRYLGGRHFQRHELEEYLRATYGWDPSEEDKNSVATTPDCRTRPMDPGQPLPESSDLSDVTVNASTLECEGWKIVKGGPLQNYLYLRPGVKKGKGTLGIDYFTSLQEALDAYIAEVEDTQSNHSKPSVANARPRRLDLEDEVSNKDPYSPKESSKMKNTKKTVSPSHWKKQSKIKSKDRNHKNVKSDKNVQATLQKQKKKNAHATKAAGSCQETLSVSTPNEVIALLQKVGFQQVDENALSFKFSESLFSQFSLVGVSVFLARYGIPNAHKLKAAELEKVTTWVRLANISKVTRAQLRECECLSSDEVVGMLKEFEFEEISGEFFIPNVVRHERVYGIHFFREERLQTEFRAFLGWALDYAAILEPVKDNKDGTRVLVHHLAFVSKIKANSLEHHRYTKLRLWAASNNAPLPSFSTRKLDLNFLDALVDPTIKISVTNASQSRAPPTQTPSAEDERPPILKTKERKQPTADKLKSSPRAWHEEYVGRLIDPTVLAILQKLGFQDQGSKIIVHPAISGKRFTLEEVRRYMVQNYIVDFEKRKRELEKGELQMLHRWCCYINLDHKVFMPHLSNAKVLTDERVVKVLQTLGFGCVSGDYYLPGADRNRLTRKSFTLPQLFEYCRSHAVWSINGVAEIGIHSYKKFDVDLSDWVDMLLTMARVDEQILAFKTPSKQGGRCKRRRESSEDIEMQSLVSAPKKKAKKAYPVIDDSQVDVAGMQIEQQNEANPSEHVDFLNKSSPQEQTEDASQTPCKDVSITTDVEPKEAPEVGGSHDEVCSNVEHEKVGPEIDGSHDEICGDVEHEKVGPEIDGSHDEICGNVEHEKVGPEIDGSHDEVCSNVEHEKVGPEIDGSHDEICGNVEHEKVGPEIDGSHAEVCGDVEHEKVGPEIDGSHDEICGNVEHEKVGPEIDGSHAEIRGNVEHEKVGPEIDGSHAEVSDKKKEQQSECTTYGSDQPASGTNHASMSETDVTQNQPLTQCEVHLGQEEKSHGPDFYHEMEEDDMFFDPLDMTEEEAEAAARAEDDEWLTQLDGM